MFRVLVDPVYAIVNQNSLKTPDLHSSWCADHFAPVFSLWGFLWAEFGHQACLGFCSALFIKFRVSIRQTPRIWTSRGALIIMH